MSIELYKYNRKAHEATLSLMNETGKAKNTLIHFCIDVLNKGVYVEDISGVILFHPTTISASKTKEPIIFDIVNNFENLNARATYSDSRNGAKPSAEQVAQFELIGMV